MPTRRSFALLRAGSALALTLLIAACTSGGQFDPTEVLSTDIFNTKKKLQGDREPLFPNGVPGAETGVPPELIKGYQPPPEPAADNTDAAAKAAAAPTKPKPKPKVAHTTPASSSKPQAKQSAQSPWPAAPQTAPAQSGQTNWPASPSTAPAQAAQTNWPPPPTGQAQQAAQPAQSIWPNPPASGTH